MNLRVTSLVLTMRDRLVACCPCFETLASLAPPAITAKPLRGQGVVVFQQVRPHPEERALARVSKDGRESMRCGHPSRCLLRKLLRMRSEIHSQPLRRPPTGRANARPMTGSVAVSKDGPQYRFVIPGTSRRIRRPVRNRSAMPADIGAGCLLTI